MPSIGIHLLVLDDVVSKLGESQNSDDQALHDHINRNPDFAALGAVGPDLLYFWGILARILRLRSLMFITFLTR